jgi:hypothetical protein
MVNGAWELLCALLVDSSKKGGASPPRRLESISLVLAGESSAP